MKKTDFLKNFGFALKGRKETKLKTEEGDISSVLPQELTLTTLKSAVSDAVWEKLLPNDYKDIVGRSVPLLDLSRFRSKKELYLRLCEEPVLIDGGNKSFILEKKSGKKCFMIGARELDIAWNDNPQYWIWVSLDESRFAKVAKLRSVCWLHISGTIDARLLSWKTTYTVYLVIKIAVDAHGLDNQVAEVSVDFATGEGCASGTRSAWLGLAVNSERRRGRAHFPQSRGDGWMELEMGEFYNDNGEDGKVAMSLIETQSGCWKGGVVVEGIEVRPKGSRLI